MKMQSKCWLTWLPKEKDSHFHAEFYKQKGLNIKEVVWEEKKPYLCDSQNIDSWNEKRNRRICRVAFRLSRERRLCQLRKL